MCTYCKIFNGQWSTERSKKILPSGPMKVAKSAKSFFPTVSPLQNWWFDQEERSARSRTIRWKSVSELWWRPKWHWLTSKRPLEKFDFFESRSELICYVVWTFHNHVTHNRVQIAPWVIFIKMNIGQRSNDWVQKIYLSCRSDRKKFSEVLFSIFHVDSQLQNCDFLYCNGPNGLGP